MHGTPVDIFIAHIGEVHDSTAQISHPSSVTLGQNSEDENIPITSNVPTSTIPKSRKEYMREYMKRKRAQSQYKEHENEKKKVYNKNYKLANSDKVRESAKQSSAKYRQSNPERVRESDKNSNAQYRQCNPEKVKKSNVDYKESNPEKVKESAKNQIHNIELAIPRK